MTTEATVAGTDRSTTLQTGRRAATAACFASGLLLGLVGRMAAICQANMPPMIYPPVLQRGDLIQVVAPSGSVERDRIQVAKQQLEQLGYRVRHRADLFDEVGYLAGSDERRATELMEAFLDPEVKAIFPATGGYGAMRILARLDYNAIRAHPKIVVGFSDTTALHAALNRRAGLVTFHTPSPQGFFSKPSRRAPLSFKYFDRAVFSTDRRGYAIDIPADLPQPIAWGEGRAAGRLTGGNLSLISALEGTPYAIDCRDAILLIEDVREAPYRVDRMLQQLQLAGKLDQLRGAVLGAFTRNYDREEDQMTDDARFSVDGVLRQYFEDRGIPVLMGYPVGHQKNNVALPLGGLVEVDADAHVLRVLPASEPASAE